jgi:hypothetical protein
MTTACTSNDKGTQQAEQLARLSRAAFPVFFTCFSSSFPGLMRIDWPDRPAHQEQRAGISAGPQGLLLIV